MTRVRGKRMREVKLFHLKLGELKEIIFDTDN